MMKTLKKFLFSFFDFFRKIELVDRCLILFMIILMTQSAYNLFSNECNSQETANIDIIVRTTSAAIFGYFLSANFIRKTGPKKKDSSLSAMNFSDSHLPMNQAALSEEEETGHQQIMIATIMGIFALFTLILARNFFTITPAMLATISQLRDFVSGCVGFLLGTPGAAHK